MNRLQFPPAHPRNLYRPGKEHVLNVLISTATACVLFAATPYAVAQIPQGNGSAQPDNRTSAMGSTPDPSASMVHESHKPQTKDGGSATTRGKTGDQGHKTQGAGGFDNGLYGTGAGSNK